MKESKRRRRKQLGKLMAKSRSQPVNLPGSRPLMNRLEGKIKMASEKVSRKMVLESKYVNANNVVIHTENSKLLLDLNCSPKELEKTVVNSCGIEHSAAKRVFRSIQSSCTMWTMSNQVTRRKQHLYCERMRQLECLERVSHTRYSLKWSSE